MPTATPNLYRAILDRLRERVGWLARWRWVGLALALLHGLVALQQYCAGLNFCADEGRCQWDWFWQTIPMVDLLGRPWSSLWHLHAQPPGFSLWGWLWLKLGSPASFPNNIQLGYVLLGMAVVAMTWRLALQMTRNPALALAGGLWMALNPSLLLFESYLLYEPLVIFLLVTSVWSLGRGLQASRGRWLAVFVLALNVLVLTRSLYHWVFLVGAMAFAWPLWRAIRPGRRWALLLMVVVLPGLWYAKNAAQYGFFGASSWYGLGLYKCAHKGYSYQELQDLIKAGKIHRYLEDLDCFGLPPRYYAQYGYTQTSPVPLLARFDFHNINVPPMSRAYAEGARFLILNNPWRYLKAVYNSYTRFSRPPSQFEHLMPHRREYVQWEPLYAAWMHGQGLTDEVEIYTYIQFGSLFFFVFPVLMTGGAVWGVAVWRRSRGGAGEAQNEMAHEDRARAILMGYMLYACLYVCVIGCMMENGENERFRFATEPLTLVIGLTLLRSWWLRWGRRAAARLRPHPASSRRPPAR